MRWFDALMERRLFTRGVPLAILVLIVGAIAGGVALGTTATCSNTATLSGSAFEIDQNANLKVDTAGCIDWLNDAGTAMRSGVQAKNDTASGANDESFGQGTAEDNPNPTVVTGSIPPNKSDLKAFGVYTEQQFLELFWSRVQNPSGTTNMDFELNQEFCDGTATHCANNGTAKAPLYITPKRTAGDKLITYDLSRGGTIPTISIRTWSSSSSAWGPATVISGGQNASALGSVNTSTIPANETGGLGSQDPFTFGEAAISFDAIFGTGTCGTFGSAYLKSRSSDSFTAEIKDFVPPERVNISNCPSGVTTTATASATVGDPISDTAHLQSTGTPTGTITFHLYPSLTDCQNNTNEINTGLTPVSVNGNGDYNSGNYTTTAAGTYYWTATYSGDATHNGFSTSCGDANESSVVNKAKPSISTTLSADSITVGDSAHDSATLSGATSDAGGTVTYTVYTDNACSLGARDAGTVNVTNGSVPDSNSLQFNSSGTYYWQASYSGDANNEAATSACQSETLVVNKKQPAISTTATDSVIIGNPISDTAHLSSATSDAGGTITFKLYSDANCTQEVNTGLQPVTVSGNGDYNSGNYTPTAVGTYYWIASYSGDANNLAVSGSCNDANESSVVNKAPASIASSQSFYPNDSATVSANAGGTPTGTVKFTLYDGAGCTGNVLFDPAAISLSGGSASTNNTSFAIDSSQTVYWKVEYSGDASHDPASSCVENTQLTINNG